MRHRSLPLGIDIGTTGLRIVAATTGARGPLIGRVVSRQIPPGYATSGEIAEPEFVAALLDQAIEDLDTPERRCVCSVGAPEALLRAVQLPQRSAKQRTRAALRYAASHIDYAPNDALIRIHPLQGSLHALGVVRKAALQSRVLTLRRAGMKVIAFDHEALALGRAFPDCGILVDVGYERTSVHRYGATIPATIQTPGGGAQVTRAIQTELAIDAISAEKRKCELGTLGAGDSTRGSLVLDLMRSIDSLRGLEHEVRAIGLVGSGSRLSGLAAELQAKTGVPVNTPALRFITSAAHATGTAKANAVGWALAAGLSLWEVDSSS